MKATTTASLTVLAILCVMPFIPKVDSISIDSSSQTVSENNDNNSLDLDDLAEIFMKPFAALGVLVNAIANAIGWLFIVACALLGLSSILGWAVKKNNKGK